MWLLGAVAYGFSWPLLDGANLSWLAWGAFVPLFVALRDQDSLGPYAGRLVGFLALATLIYGAGCFFGFPVSYTHKMAMGGAVQVLLLAVPLLLVFAIRTWIPYDRALLVLVFVWPLWEWGLQHVPISLNLTSLAYSQSANTWLIQYIDLFGAWAITAWLLLFNVLIYRMYVAANERFTRAFWRAGMRVAFVMLVVPLVYAGVRYMMLTPSEKPVHITLISTNLAPILERAEQALSTIERSVYLTDSTAYYHRGPKTDLYVWPEGMLGFDWEVSNLRSFLYEAVDEWQTPLLTGATMREVRPSSAPDTILSNQALLIHPRGDSTRTLHVYNKMKLVQMQEGIPGYRYLQAIPAIRAYHKEHFKMTPGESIALLPLEMRDGRTIQVATPICHEGTYPELWAEMTRAGADIFVQPVFESWFGEWGFQNILANIARLRAIENRRSTARSANGGVTVFVDAFGTMRHRIRKAEGSSSAYVRIYDGQSLYTRFPYLFPLICIVGLIWFGRAYWPST